MVDLANIASLRLLGTYDPGQVLIVFAGIPIPPGAFAPDTFLTIEPDTDAVTHYVGVSGFTCIGYNRNTTQTITLNVMYSSPVNLALNAAALARTVGPFAALDVSGKNLFIADTCWIHKYPTITYARDAGIRTYVFKTPLVIPAVGSGNALPF